MERHDVPVLVVGAGPVGLTASLLLSQHGVRHLVVDRRPGPHRAPQAHVLNPRSLEIFRQIGIDTARLRALATPRRDGGHVSWVTRLAGEELGRLPFERQGDDALAFTPEPLLNLPQHVLEPILLDYVTQAPASEMRYRHEWQALEQDDEGVTSHLTDTSTGDRYEVRSRWMLAADGAGSRVRKGLAIPMVGPDRLQSFVMVHFEANLRPLVRDCPAILYWVADPDCAGSFVAHDIDHTWVFMHPYDPDTEAPESYDEVRCAGMVRGAIGRDDVVLRVRDVSSWTMTAQIASSYRAGRVFLIGDSAHRFPPTGGMGMNSGIADAHGLVWKLRFVDEGLARPMLLDTHEVERRPVAEHNSEQSLTNAMRMLEMAAELGFLGDDPATARATLDGLLATPEGRTRIAEGIAQQRDHFDMLGLQLGYAYEAGAVVPDGTSAPVVENPVRDYLPSGRPGMRVPHAWVQVHGRRRSSLDLLAGDAFTLITGPTNTDWPSVSAGLARVPLRCVVAGRDFEDGSGAWLRACGIEPGGALLVRPDQHIAWRATTAPPDPAGALMEALSLLL